VINAAAERQTIYLRTFQTGDQAELAEQLLKEVSTARICLLNPRDKGDYDQQLHMALTKQPMLKTPMQTDNSTALKSRASASAGSGQSLHSKPTDAKKSPREPTTKRATDRGERTYTSARPPGQTTQPSHLASAPHRARDVHGKFPVEKAVAAGVITLVLFCAFLGRGAILTWFKPAPNQINRSDRGPAANDPVGSEPSRQEIKPPLPAITPFDAKAAEKHQQDWADHLGTPVEITNSIGMQLKLIPGGKFQMGSPDSEPDRDDDETRHLVKISRPFYLSVHGATQQQYEKVMGTRPWQGKNFVKEGADYPAVYVNHDDAAEFCRRLSGQEGVEYRLPTEAEWEYACRAGTTTAYSSGDDESKLGQHAWYYRNAWLIDEKYAHRVGQKLPNPWGLYDLHGNVHEWCQDWYGPYGSQQVASDPMGPTEGDRRVLRGGSIGSLSSFVRSASRFYGLPANRDNLGFRVARTYSVPP
jgi:formylglycine-generating enzyme required for sulfatase activity